MDLYSGAILDLCDGLSRRHHVPKWYHDNLYPLQGPHDSRANPETEANPPEAGWVRWGRCSAYLTLREWPVYGDKDRSNWFEIRSHPVTLHHPPYKTSLSLVKYHLWFIHKWNEIKRTIISWRNWWKDKFIKQLWSMRARERQISLLVKYFDLFINPRN